MGFASLVMINPRTERQKPFAREIASWVERSCTINQVRRRDWREEVAPPLTKNRRSRAHKVQCQTSLTTVPIAIAEEGSRIWQEILPVRLKLTPSVSPVYAGF